MATVNDIRSLRYGLRATLFILVCSVISVASIPFLTSDIQAFHCIGRPYIGGGAQPVNFIWTCPDLLRLALVSTISALVIFAATGAGYWVTMRDIQKPFRGSFTIRMICVGLTVGAMSLFGTYVSEYFGGQGKLSPFYVFGVPLLVSMLHYPRWLGLALAIPALVLGFLGLVFIATITGIPLD